MKGWHAMNGKLLSASALVCALLLGACGDGGQVTGPPTAAPTAASTSSEQPTADEGTEPPAGGAVTTLDDAKAATIQIVAEGTFEDPEFGTQLNAAGAGSGFIIDPSGIAVTNNHVVTGAALLQVYIGGEDEARNARVLGYSECSDLAVIDIDGDGYPYLDWYDGEITTGLDVFAAGFPLGDPEYTLTRGIVSKAQTNGETNWASVDRVLEHDATINPGNSGGPLITPEGAVVGINYAGADDTNQYFAIGQEEANTILERIRKGENVNSIGVNGQAVNDGEGLSGIWVASVASGSPADKAGIQAGDIITKLENLALATDGTMADFCDVLRSRTTFDTMQIEVLRYSTEEVLAGQLNGDELEQSFSFAQELDDTVAEGSGGESDVATYSGYQTVSDDTGVISVEVPNEWTEIDGSPFDHEGNTIADVTVSTDIEAFQGTWTTPGARISASTDLARTENETSLLDLLSTGFGEECEHAGRFPYEDPLYTGQYDVFTNCGGQGVTYVIVGAVNASRSAVIGVQVQAVESRDLDALDRILSSFVAG
jgi:serine protease Do